MIWIVKEKEKTASHCLLSPSPPHRGVGGFFLLIILHISLFFVILQPIYILLWEIW